MSSLPSLEHVLGSLHSWPQDILRYLFLVSSTPYTIHELAAFFYGNEIQLQLALDFFKNVPLPCLTKLTPFVPYTMLGTAISTARICMNSIMTWLLVMWYTYEVPMTKSTCDCRKKHSHTDRIWCRHFSPLCYAQNRRYAEIIVACLSLLFIVILHYRSYHASHPFSGTTHRGAMSMWPRVILRFLFAFPNHLLYYFIRLLLLW